MRLSTATITANTAIGNKDHDVHLIEFYAPQLAQAVQAGQYCMLRCCDAGASDPLLRRPFFIHSRQRGQGLCTLLVHVAGRGTAWLARQPVGAPLDVLGPLGHGWSISPNAHNLLLVSDMHLIAPLPFLMQTALEQQLAVTLLCQSRTLEDAYPPALLPPEVEYHIVTQSEQASGDLQSVLGEYLSWADAAYCCVPRETATGLYNHFERLRGKHFAQGVVLRPFVCGSGACFACSIQVHSGQKLVCRDGPVFALREIAR
jgi:dihydroorotate dehydrogenase electron transfer subunit